MTEIKEIVTDGRSCRVTVSDEKEALLAAQAAGRAVVAIGSDFWEIPYAAETWDAVDDGYLERVARRKLGLPWVICETKRLLIREFQLSDCQRVPKEREDSEADRIFQKKETLKEYIRYQYGFYEYGIWAVIRKDDGMLIGKAGVTNFDGKEEGLELGYHIFAPFRRQGFALECCQTVLKYVKEQFLLPVYAKIDLSNERSIRLIERLGFEPEDGTDSGSAQRLYRFWQS